ncbi:hypothetical protein, unlikely [Trypanosoma brucei gambiense DAL972]|uniref:Uncharacterized protein n=1 Tax=Trypanosoma brucei gambiense (strain MHOM/CI/86/DAL972) TaxID=679716 RepID=D0A5Z8_TRYB9|nr:hypothetical protein, unlikely [Trypanosoma brucei gambiense DAL972]CBH17099.1 hypothetical protein, unlikely [Trypanosoma brucei gambiense DAL972]|eukprot:XP_011779363.1 hypothetical protein, unlikely [Trypanosoma brucei gambiense DAL972]
MRVFRRWWWQQYPKKLYTYESAAAGVFGELNTRLLRVLCHSFIYAGTGNRGEGVFRSASRDFFFHFLLITSFIAVFVVLSPTFPPSWIRREKEKNSPVNAGPSSGASCLPCE